MIALLQRVRHASVDVKDRQIASIGPGLLVLLGVEKNDSSDEARRLVQRMLGYRVFEDEQGRMNRSLLEVRGELLLVPQFTLAADTHKGMRPSFSSAASPEQGRALFDEVIELSRPQVSKLATGQFGADMQVTLVNDGPVTFWLQVG